MSPEDLGQILEGMVGADRDPRALVGFESADDAGVYRLDDERALVFTVDMITPIVDDPRDFGRIAAANSISDVYAMGGQPLMALNVSGFAPGLPPQLYREILQGAQEIAKEAGVLILGGHTIKDKEIKYGLAVVGEVHPDKILRNRGAQEGDVLVLTKALGTSALATAFKSGAFDESDARYKAMVNSMTRLNREAGELAIRHGAHALTDITGFGLSGHLLEMVEGSGLAFTIRFDSLPLLPGALEMLAAGHTCGGGEANRKRARGKIDLPQEFEIQEEYLLHDPQTSGGLLMATTPSEAEEIVSNLNVRGYAAAIIGEVTAESAFPLRVTV